MSTYSRVRASGLPNRTPCQPSDTCGPDSPRPSRNRPPDRVSRVAAVIAVAAGERGPMPWGLEPDADGAAAQLVASREAGATLIATAVSYGYGRSEQLIGQLIADVVPRDEVVIATKAGIIRTDSDRTVDAGRGELL